MSKSTLIIAEAGVNHNGDIDIAKRMIDVAADSGVDVVKFQTFKADGLVLRKAEKADYQKNSSDNNESQFEMIKKLELDRKMHLTLIDYCKSKNIIFCSTAFDLDSIDLLHSMDIPFWKIPSGEITNLPYIRKIGQLGKKIILSTGMATLVEIGQCIDVLLKSGAYREDITVLHCNTEYPTPIQDVNLSAMNTIKNAYKVKIGYSDHTLGIEIPIAAVAMGACVIEKHFTLDKKMIGPDHRASLEPDELKEMVRAIRSVEKALGNGIKKPSPSEIKNIDVARKSIVASTAITKGEKFSNRNITVKRPGSGTSPMNWDNIIGSIALKDYREDDFV